MPTITGYAAQEPGGALSAFTYDPGPLAADQVEIDVIACGVCHSDLSMINNDWRNTQYPIVPGHEIVGKVAACGDAVSHISVGQTVGVGWMSGSCLTCQHCVSGSQHHCRQTQPTIVGHHGGFANRVRAQAVWTIPLPEGLDAKQAGPLFCGGITVFTPFMEYDIKPTDRVAVVGIGGLGHLALKFARAWGCEVTAFTTSMDKTDALKAMGAHKVVNSRDKDALKALRGTFDAVISTVNVSLEWHRYIAALAPKGRLILVGGVDEPLPIPAFSLIGGQKSLGGSETGSPAMIAKMLDFCQRHNIYPDVEYFDMANVNDAIAHLKSGKARYRIVLTN